MEPFPVEQWYPREINGKWMENYIQWVMLTYAFTVAGVPALGTVRIQPFGLPVGLQIAGRWRDEVGVLRAAAAFEQAAPWAGIRPPIPCRFGLRRAIRAKAFASSLNRQRNAVTK